MRDGRAPGRRLRRVRANDPAGTGGSLAPRRSCPRPPPRRRAAPSAPAEPRGTPPRRPQNPLRRLKAGTGGLPAPAPAWGRAGQTEGREWTPPGGGSTSGLRRRPGRAVGSTSRRTPLPGLRLIQSGE